MPKCIHAATRRTKNPKGLPAAVAIFKDREALVHTYLGLCNDLCILIEADPWEAGIKDLRAAVERLGRLKAQRALKAAGVVV
jgi:hypothetical protein